MSSWNYSFRCMIKAFTAVLVIPNKDEKIFVLRLSERFFSGHLSSALLIVVHVKVSNFFVLAFFKCNVCHATQLVEIERGTINEPTACTNCNTQQSMALIHNRSQFTDKQMIKMQESPDDMPAGQTPHTVILYAYGDLVDSIQPGDRWDITVEFQTPNHRTGVWKS